VIKCPLWLNGWNDMGLAIHDWLITYVFPDYNIIAKPNHKTQDVLCFLNDYMYDFSHKLFQWILCVKNHSHILMGMWVIDNEVVTRWWVSIFIIFISFIWHPWLMTKWHGCPIVSQWLKNDYKSFDMNINKPTLHLFVYLTLERWFRFYYKLRVKQIGCNLLKK
jgi:hypothetical protein